MAMGMGMGDKGDDGDRVQARDILAMDVNVELAVGWSLLLLRYLNN